MLVLLRPTMGTNSIGKKYNDDGDLAQVCECKRVYVCWLY